MKLERYQFIGSKNLTVFEFISEGPKGKIQKIVQFSETNMNGAFNLAFGDKNIETGELDDRAVSNNGDINKILATVVASVLVFTERNYDALIFAKGSTKARTRIYRMGISKYYDEISSQFELFGLLNDEWEPFQKNKDYEGFLAKRKII